MANNRKGRIVIKNKLEEGLSKASESLMKDMLKDSEFVYDLMHDLVIQDELERSEICNKITNGNTKLYNEAARTHKKVIPELIHDDAINARW